MVAGESPAGSAISPAFAQLQEALRSGRRGWGWKSLTRHHFAHVVQCRDGALKTRTVSVQIRPWAPTACSPTQRHEAQTFESAGANPATRTISGMPTGQASRASVLTNACLRASGASPRHSAIFCARSSKRTVRLISGVALDECLDREHYPARVPFRSVVEGVRIDEELARKVSVVHPIASANLAPSANAGRSPA